MNSLTKNLLRINQFITKSFPDVTVKCRVLIQSRPYSMESNVCGGEGKKRGIILGHYLNENGESILTPASCKFNEKIQGKLLELITQSGKWERCQCRCFNNIEEDYWTVAVVCLGAKKQGYNSVEALDETRETIRRAAGCAAQMLYRQGVEQIFVEGLGRPEQAAEGSVLALWRYQEYKNKKQRHIAPTVELHDDPDVESWQRGVYQAEAQNLARRLSESPANRMNPTVFSHEAISALCPCGIKVEVQSRDWIEMQRMYGFLTASKGSCEPPIFMQMHYCGGPPEERPVCLLGKSTTLDAGGLCLKSCEDMRRLRPDMTAASCIVAVMRAAAMLSLPMNITGAVALSENLPSGMAMRIGDIVTLKNGTSVEVQRADSDGHLIMADCLLYVQKELRPRMIVDLTTMNEGCNYLLGDGAVAAFSNSENLWKQMRKAGVITGDRVWRLPIWKYFKRKSANYTYVDLNNRGVGDGLTCLAAGYLAHFVDCIDWIHMDTQGIGNVCNNKSLPYYTHHFMMGRPTRTIIQFLYQLACPNECDQPY